MSVHLVWAVLTGQEPVEDVISPAPEVTDCWKPPCWCWEPNPWSSGEWSVPLTLEPSLHPCFLLLETQWLTSSNSRSLCLPRAGIDDLGHQAHLKISFDQRDHILSSGLETASAWGKSKVGRRTGCQRGRRLEGSKG